MKKYQVTDRAEFEARQMPLFDFVTNLVIKAARDVAEHIAARVKPWWAGFKARMAAPAKKCHQLVLELNSIAQMPLHGV